MRTHHRRPLAIAATLTAALLGGGMLAAQPAAAATDTTSIAVTDCGTTSVGADGMLDVDLLQACLGRLQASLTPEMPDAPEPAYEALESEPAENTDEPEYFEAEYVEVTVEEAAPVDEGLGGAFAALRDCESGGDYGINTGNGYYGAYQFALSTWEGLGYGGYPHEASPAVQDQAASELQSLYGWSQWPACSWYLGLG